MEANKILQADLLDLVFEGRNKDYGAYELRKRYNKRISLALAITAAVVIIAVAATFISKLSSSANDDLVSRDVVIEKVAEKEEKPPPPPPPPKTPPPPKVETTKFTPPIIKKDEEVKKEEIPPVEEVAKVDVKTEEGVKDENIATPPVVDDNKQVVETPKEDPDQIFTKVEIEAKVDPKAWRRHLESQLQRYIEDAASQGMAPGQYTVQVRFLVERDGSIADVQNLSDPGYGLGKGAVDVVRKGPKWEAGEQNGRKVRSYHTQPITFVIAEE